MKIRSRSTFDLAALKDEQLSRVSFEFKLSEEKKPNVYGIT